MCVCVCVCVCYKMHKCQIMIFYHCKTAGIF